MATSVFRPDTVFPATADLRLTVGDRLPPEVLESWLASDRSARAQRRILRPYRVHGTVACSDSAGLTRLSAERHLLEMELLIHWPKVILYEYGAAVGGQGIGTWKADNTCMFYPSDVVGELAVLHQLAAAQRTIRGECLVQVGVGVRKGYFYQLGRSLYGPNFETIEAIAEDEVPATVVVWQGRPIAGHEALFEPFAGAEALAPAGTLWQVRYEQLPAVAPRRPGLYPLPFSSDFLARVSGLDSTHPPRLAADFPDLVAQVHICFVKAYLPPHLLLLEAQLQLAAVHYLIGRAAGHAGVRVAEYAGPVAIVADAGFGPLLAFARALAAEGRPLGFAFSFGVASGEVLCERPPGGGLTIIGGAAVNYASKLAEDAGQPHRLQALDSCQPCADAAFLAASEPFALTVSRVLLRGVRVRV